MKKELSVIIPAYNEEAAILSTLTEVASYLSGHGYRFEILVVNDGSRDSTLPKAREAASRHPQIRVIDIALNAGKGEAVKRGVEEAVHPYCLFMDADNSTRIDEWAQFEKAFEEGARVVVASRWMEGSRIVHAQPLMRRFLGTGYRVLCRQLFGLSAKDFNCGFKAYETPIAKKVYAQVDRKDWTFDLEVFCLLRRDGLDVREVPVRWEHKEKKSNLKPLQSAVSSLGSLLQIQKKLQRLPG